MVAARLQSGKPEAVKPIPQRHNCPVSVAPFGLINARDASSKQKVTAFDSYFHYDGSWRIKADEVVHTLTMALNPDMAGCSFRRMKSPRPALPAAMCCDGKG
jgi:hypothetical protein